MAKVCADLDIPALDELKLALAALRRDQQQIVAALQEVARKVETLDRLSRVKAAHLDIADANIGTVALPAVQADKIDAGPIPDGQVTAGVRFR